MKYIPGLITGELRGAAGNFVASRNTYGCFIGPRVTPVDPSTESQENNRELFQDCVNAWFALSPEDRVRWNVAAAEQLRHDALGASYALTGQNYFMSIQMNRALATGSASTGPPPDASLIVTLDNLIVGSYDDMTAYWDNAVGALTRIAFFATAGLSPGRSYIRKSDYRLIHVTDVNPSAGYDLGGYYDAKFGGPPSTGELVGFRAKTINAFYVPGPWSWFRAYAPN